MNISGTAIPGLENFRLVLLDETTSTNDDCLRAAEAGEAEGLVVMAKRQTRGRGRQGRSWYTAAGACLAFSLLLRPKATEADCLGRFSAVAGLALVRVLDQTLPGVAGVKWPNDVLVGGRKVCGILPEAFWRGGQAQALVLGMGVNLQPEALPADLELTFPASDLCSALGRDFNPQELLIAILREVDALRPAVPTTDFLALWNQRLAWKGELARVRSSTGQLVRVQILGVNPDGSLLTREPSGRERIFYSAELEGSAG